MEKTEALRRASEAISTLTRYPDRKCQELYLAAVLQMAWSDGRLAGIDALDQRMKAEESEARR